jgi:hypothetical protein
MLSRGVTVPLPEEVWSSCPLLLPIYSIVTRMMKMKESVEEISKDDEG